MPSGLYEQWKAFLSWAKSKLVSGTEPQPVGEKNDWSIHVGDTVIM